MSAARSGPNGEEGEGTGTAWGQARLREEERGLASAPDGTRAWAATPRGHDRCMARLGLPVVRDPPLKGLRRHRFKMFDVGGTSFVWVWGRRLSWRLSYREGLAGSFGGKAPRVSAKLRGVWREGLAKGVWRGKHARRRGPRAPGPTGARREAGRAAGSRRRHRGRGRGRGPGEGHGMGARDLRAGAGREAAARRNRGQGAAVSGGREGAPERPRRGRAPRPARVSSCRAGAPPGGRNRRRRAGLGMARTPCARAEVNWRYMRSEASAPLRTPPPSMCVMPARRAWLAA